MGDNKSRVEKQGILKLVFLLYSRSKKTENPKLLTGVSLRSISDFGTDLKPLQIRNEKQLTSMRFGSLVSLIHENSAEVGEM